MQKLIGVILFSVAFFCASGVYAQQNHFIYIENEDHKPFSVSVNGKTFNSSDIGHVIISKLTDGKYNLNINFPGNKIPAQSFTCEVNKKDIGFNLKNIPASGWALVDLATSKINLSNNAHAGNELGNLQGDNNGAFGDMLSQVVNDTALTKNNTVTQPETVKEEKVKPAEDISLQNSIDSAMKEVDKTFDAVIEDSAHNTVDDQTPADTVAASNVLIVPALTEPAKQNESQTIQADSSISQQKQETVTNNDTGTTAEIFTPSDSAEKEISNPFFQKKTETAETIIISSEGQTPAVKNDTPVQNNEAVKTEEIKNEPSAADGNAVYKPDCKGLIKDDEFEKIKRKMFVQNGNTAMVQTCLKLTGDRCFTTEQVKKLGGLFLSDDGRYSLFDAMYGHVYDKGNYSALENQIIDPYYRKRFEAMLDK